MRVIVVVLLFSGLVAYPLTVAQATTVCTEKPLPGGGTETVCTDIDPGEGGTGGGSGNGPSCHFSGTFDEFCDGTAACWGNNPSAAHPKELEGVPKPDKDSHVAYKSCQRPDGSVYGTWYWTTDGAPSLEDRVRQARGLLLPPRFQATFNPPTRTYVNLDTWWWAAGAPSGDIIGGEALGVRAIASPRRMIVEPGDGSPSFSCPIITTKSDACTYTYRRASNRGDARAPDGSHAYAAEVRLVYAVRYVSGGQPVDELGLPTELFVMEGRGTVAVPVREIQTRVTGVN